MSSNKVVSMADMTGDGTFASPRQALEDAINSIGKEDCGAFKEGKKLLILVLDDEGDLYDTSFIQAGMKMSECLALCEVAKQVFLEEMGY